MPPPLLLVHDDLATIASVRRALTRAGHALQLATSTADALSAVDQLSPSAILLAPAVEGGRGASFLLELRTRAQAANTPVLLLGQTVEDSGLPVLALPLDAQALLEAVEAALSPKEAEEDDVPLLDAGHMEELPPLVDAALAEAEADLEAEAFASLHAPAAVAAGEAAPTAAREAEEVAAAEALTHAAWEEADLARARAEAAEAARAEAESARAQAEEALRAYRQAEAVERSRRTEAEARARAEAEEARRLERQARAAQAQVEAARARAEEAEGAVRAAQAQGTAEAELLATALREEEARRTSELAVQQRLREEAEARAQAEAEARAVGEARAAADVARLAGELREREAAAARAQASAEARAAEQLTRLAQQVQERDAAARHARAEAEDWAARQRQALSQAEQAQAQAQALEVEAAQLAERLAQGERAALEALARAEEALRRERAAGEALRGELAAARAAPPPPTAPAPPAALARPAEAPPVRRGPRPAAPPAATAPAAATAAVRLEWGAADGGRLSLEQLAALVLRLAEVKATARLELRAEETLRLLWLADGALVGAASTHPAESLPQLALADGLLDAATAAEARALRLPDEALAAELVERGLLREAEVVPLLQRCTEARALEALSERDSAYRLAADGAPPTGGCATARPLEAVLAEAVQRALTPEEVALRTGGPHGVPRRLQLRELTAFELAPREGRLLEAVDGQRTVLELLSASGLRQEVALRTLAVGAVLGLLEVTALEAAVGLEAHPEVELERLREKWTSAEEADYFSVLGLPRTAGTEEVQRAHARLAAEFHPLRYAGHPDPEVPARAARLATLLDEAAAALSDERLRAAYARSLVDAEGGSRA